MIMYPGGLKNLQDTFLKGLKMEKSIKWGIIAAGGIAKRRTLPAIGQITNAQVIAVMDKNKDVLDELSGEYKIPYVYTEERELLENPEIDAVYVASPVCFHKAQAIEVLRAGKHLLLEKPLGMNEREAEEIAEAARRTDKKAGVAMVMKHHPAHRKIKELLDKKTIGEIVSCRTQLNCWFPDMEGNWRQRKDMAGGGALVDMGTHCIDLLRYFLDDEVEWVFGDISTKTFRYEVDDSADCILHMHKGASCYVDVHFNIPDEAAKGMLEIYGTKGSILAQGTIGQDGRGEVYLNLCAHEAGYNSGQIREQSGLGQKISYEYENIYGTQIQSFSDSIMNDMPVRTTLKDALATVRTIDALYRSMEEKRIIYL